MPRLITMRPCSRSGSHRAFCCDVAYSAKVRIGPKLPNCTTSALRGHTDATPSGAPRAHGGDLLDGDHRVHQGAALPAIGLGKADAHEPLRAHEFRDVERIARIVRALERLLFEMGEREAANRIGEGLL